MDDSVTRLDKNEDLALEMRDLTELQKKKLGPILSLIS